MQEDAYHAGQEVERGRMLAEVSVLRKRIRKTRGRTRNAESTQAEIVCDLMETNIQAAGAARPSLPPDQALTRRFAPPSPGGRGD